VIFLTGLPRRHFDNYDNSMIYDYPGQADSKMIRMSVSLLHLLAANHKMFVLLYVRQRLLEHIVLRLGSSPVKVQLHVQSKLMDGREGVHLFLQVLSSIFLLELSALLRSVVMFYCLIEGARMRSSEDGGSKLFCGDVTEVLVIHGLLGSDPLSRVVC
jgi:hypothetical protein